MPDTPNRLQRLWRDLNPSDPSPMFLAKLMAFMLTCFALALVIGHYT